MSSDEIRQMVAQALRDELRKAGAVQNDSDEMLTVAEASVFSKYGVSTIRSWFGKKLTRYGGKRKPLVRKSELVEVLRKMGCPSSIDVDAKVDELLGRKH